MKIDIAVMGDLCRDNGFEEPYTELVSTHIVFFVPEDKDEDVPGWRAYVGKCGSLAEAHEKCTRTDGVYQIVNLHEETCVEVVIANKKVVDRRKHELAEILEEWEEKQTAFQAKYGRPMTQRELDTFRPRALE